MATHPAPKLDLEVYIDDERYFLTDIPPDTSAIVVKQRNDMLAGVRLDSLADDLARVGKFIRVAYNGVVAAGPRFTELQIKVRNVGYDVADLCSESAIAATKFKDTSQNILVNVQAAYEFLVDGLEEIAMPTLASVFELAKGAAHTAEELRKQAEADKEKVREILNEAERLQGEEATREDDLKTKREKMEYDQKVEEQLMEDAQKAEVKAEAAYSDFLLKEDKEIQNMKELGKVEKVINYLTGHTQVAEKRAFKYKDLKLEQLKLAEEQRKHRQEALTRIADFAKQLTECGPGSGEEEMAKVAVKALHEVLVGLAHVSALLQQLTTFWKQIETQSKMVSDETSPLKRQLGFMESMTEDRRHKLWTSRSFKKMAMEFYAKWVALHSACLTYTEHIAVAQEDLTKYIRDTPTYEQARLKVGHLAKEFITDVDMESRKIDEENRKGKEQMESLASTDESKES